MHGQESHLPIMRTIEGARERQNRVERHCKMEITVKVCLEQKDEDVLATSERHPRVKVRIKSPETDSRSSLKKRKEGR